MTSTTTDLVGGLCLALTYCKNALPEIIGNIRSLPIVYFYVALLVLFVTAS